MGSDQSPWEDVGQIKGDNGDNAYFFTAWAKETSSGAIDTTQPILHGSEIAADPSKLTEEYTWWSYATNTTNQEPDDYEDFTWQYVKGDKGDKGDGNFTHVKLMSQILPEGYTRLSYIGYNSYKNGGPVVNAGLRPTDTRGMKIILRHKYSNTTSYNFGARSGSSTSNYVRFVFIRDGSNKFYVGWGKSLFPAAEDRPSWPKDTWATCELNFRNSRKWRFNEEEGDITSTLSGYSSSGYAIRAFGFNQYSQNADVQESIITDGEEVVQHWIAARRESDGLVGMYDIINDNFIGDEDFIAGEDWDGSEMIGIATTTSAEAPKDLDAYEWMEIPEGASGAGISNVTHYYLVNDMATGVTHETTGWSTTPQVTTAQNKYLWEYVEVTFTDGRTPTVTTPTRTGMFAESATLYDIQVMSNTLHIDKDKIYDGEALVEVHKIEGSTDTKLNTTDDGIKVRYHVNTEEDVADWDVVSGGTSGNFYLARYDGEDPTDYGGFAKALIIEALDSENHVLRTESVSITEDGGDGAQGESGTSPYIARFDNQMVSIPCDSEGNPLVTVSWTTKAQLWHGSELVEYETVGQFHYNIIQSGLSRSLTPSTDGIGVTVNGLTGTNDFNTVTVYFYETAEDASAAATAYNTSHDAASLQVGALAWCTAIVNRLRRGAQGDNPSVYDIVLSTTAVKVGNDGVCNPSKLYLSVRKTQGTTITQYLVAGNGTSGWTGQGLTLKLLVSVNGGTATEVTTFSTEGTPAKSFYAIPNNTTAITAELYQGNTMIDAQGVSLTKDGDSGDDAEYFKMVQSATTTYAKVVLTDSTLNGNSDTLHDELRISLSYEVWKIKDGGNTAEIVKTTDNLYIRYRPDNVNTFETLTKGATSTISTSALPSAWSGFVKENSIVKMAGYSSKTSKPNGVVVQLVKVTDGTAVVVDQLYVPVMLEAGSSLLVTKNMISATVQNSQLIGNLPSGETTVVGYISSVSQKADEIRNNVTSAQSSIDNINRQLAQKVDTSTFTQRATSIESEVKSVEKKLPDTKNLFGASVYEGGALGDDESNTWMYVWGGVKHYCPNMENYGTPIHKGEFTWYNQQNGNTALYSPCVRLDADWYTLRMRLYKIELGSMKIEVRRYRNQTDDPSNYIGSYTVADWWGESDTDKEDNRLRLFRNQIPQGGLYRLCLINGNHNDSLNEDDNDLSDLCGGDIQLYRGQLASSDFNDFDTTMSEAYSRIRQTANSIELKVKETGIDIDEKKIRLKAENTVVDGNLTVMNVKTTPEEGGAYAQMMGSLLAFFGSAGKANIRIGVNEDGMAVLQYYDNNGVLLYDLGPSGISSIPVQQEHFTSISGYVVEDMTGDGNAITPEDWSWMFNEEDMAVCFNPSTPSEYLYTYYAKIVAGVIDKGNSCSTEENALNANGRLFRMQAPVGNRKYIDTTDIAKYVGDDQDWGKHLMPFCGYIREGNVESTKNPTVLGHQLTPNATLVPLNYSDIQAEQSDALDFTTDEDGYYKKTVKWCTVHAYNNGKRVSTLTIFSN